MKVLEHILRPISNKSVSSVIDLKFLHMIYNFCQIMIMENNAKC